MNTPIRQIVKNSLSPRIFKSPNSPSFLNTPQLTCDLQTVSFRSPSKIKSPIFSESIVLQNNKLLEQDNLEFCSPNISNTRYINNKLEEFTIRKPKKYRKIHHEQNNHIFLSVPHPKHVPSVNTPEREELLKTDLTKLNFNILGKGSFGTVVQAIYKGKDVAVKIIRKHNTSSLLEANALNLNHPNILDVLLVINRENADNHLVVMQMCSAPDMQYLLENAVTDIPVNVCTKWIVDICSALQYCHQRGILHLDVKPKNVLVKQDKCVLCDFGNSLNLNSSEQKNNYLLKRAGGCSGGTAAYSAPELLHGEALPTSAADVYSVALTMFHVHTRTPPFHHLDNVHVLIYQVVKHNLRPITPKCSIINDCELSFRALYTRCWNQIPENRPSLHSLLTQLHEIFQDYDNNVRFK